MEAGPLTAAETQMWAKADVKKDKTDAKKDKTVVKKDKAEKQQPSKPLLSGEEVLAKLKKTAESTPTIIGGKIEKSMVLKGLVVITKDAELADDSVELTPSSETIVVNNAEAVYYKPVRISGVPFVSIATSPRTRQKSHLYAPLRYWDSPCENYVFHGNFAFDPNCSPIFTNCLFLASQLPGCGKGVMINVAPGMPKTKYVKCLFQGLEFKKGWSLYTFSNVVTHTELCGFKGVNIESGPLINPGTKIAYTLNCPANSQYRLYDFDNVIIPALKQLKMQKSTILDPLDLSKPALPYYDKAVEIGALLDDLAAKHAGTTAAQGDKK